MLHLCIVYRELNIVLDIINKGYFTIYLLTNNKHISIMKLNTKKVEVNKDGKTYWFKNTKYTCSLRNFAYTLGLLDKLL